MTDAPDPITPDLITTEVVSRHVLAAAAGNGHCADAHGLFAEY